MYSDDPNLVSRYSERISVMSKLRRRAYRIARNSVRKENVLRYIENRAHCHERCKAFCCKTVRIFH
jgi:hypothetical protein